MNEEIQEFFKLYRLRKHSIKCKWKKCMPKKEYYKFICDYDNYKDLMSNNTFKEILRQEHNRASCRYRTNKKIRDIFHNEIKGIRVFGTLTFNDSQLYTKNGKPKAERTRTKKVNQWLKDNTLYAAVNIDYGHKTGREHHHFVGILPPNTILEDTGHKTKQGRILYRIKNVMCDLGYWSIEIIEYDSYDFNHKQVTNYLKKINNHSNKITTKNRRIRIISNL